MELSKEENMGGITEKGFERIFKLKMNSFTGASFVVSLFFFGGLAIAEEQGLVAYYSFDEGAGSAARDLSGKGNDGKIQGAKYVKMPEGHALEFDGTDDYVDAGGDASIVNITGDLTIEAWAKKAQGGGDTSLVSTHYGKDDHTRPYSLLIFGDQPQFRLGNGGAQFCAQSTKLVNTNEWYHVAGTIEGNEVKIYVNGVNTGRSTFSETRQTGKKVTIGSSFLERNFTGIVDEVKIYNRALAEQEILTSYKSGWKKIGGWDINAADKSSFRKVDTTPPTVNLPVPPPDSTVSESPIISAQFADVGTGIDITSAKVLLDEQDVTKQAEVTEAGISLRLGKPPTKGIHRLEVAVSDKAGNRSNRLAWRLGVDVPVPVEARFDKGLFLVNDEPYFPIGIYTGDTRPWRSEKVLAQAAEAGINYQTVDEQSARPELLDIMLKHGQKAIMLVHPTDTIKPMLDGDRTKIESLLTIKDHPAMLGWWTEYLQGTPEGIQALTPLYRFLKENDPRHVAIWICCWSAAYKWCTNSDAYFVALYPILCPPHPEYTVLSLYDESLAHAFAAATAEGKDKQVWFVSQAFDYRFYDKEDKTTKPPHGFRPNPAELRAMNYMAVVKGVKGIVFYAPGPYNPETKEYNTVVLYPEPWKEILKIAGELRYLSPVFASGQPVKTARLEPDNPAIHYLELNHGETHTLIAVNVTETPVLAHWLLAKPAMPVVLFEDRALPEKVSDMTDTFNPLEVHIYQWKK